MKPGRPKLHLKAKHSAYVNSDLNCFIKSLKDKFAKRSAKKSLSALEVSYEMTLLFAKCGKKSYYWRGFN